MDFTVNKLRKVPTLDNMNNMQDINIEEITAQARQLALSIIQNPRRNNRKELERHIQQKALLEEMCQAVYLAVDWETFEKFMDVVNRAEVEGK